MSSDECPSGLESIRKPVVSFLMFPETFETFKIRLGLVEKDLFDLLQASRREDEYAGESLLRDLLKSWRELKENIPARNTSAIVDGLWTALRTKFYGEDSEMDFDEFINDPPSFATAEDRMHFSKFAVKSLREIGQDLMEVKFACVYSSDILDVMHAYEVQNQHTPTLWSPWEMALSHIEQLNLKLRNVQKQARKLRDEESEHRSFFVKEYDNDTEVRGEFECVCRPSDIFFEFENKRVDDGGLRPKGESFLSATGRDLCNQLRKHNGDSLIRDKFSHVRMLEILRVALLLFGKESTASFSEGLYGMSDAFRKVFPHGTLDDVLFKNIVEVMMKLSKAVRAVKY